jgi:hypothetical protein
MQQIGILLAFLDVPAPIAFDAMRAACFGHRTHIHTNAAFLVIFLLFVCTESFVIMDKLGQAKRLMPEI